MDLVQWIFESGGVLGSALAPAQAPRLGLASSGTTPPRAYAPGRRLESIHLPHPLVFGSIQNGEDNAAAPASVHLRLIFSGGGEQARPPIAPDDKAHLVLARFAEMTDVIAELLVAVELPLSNLMPSSNGLDLVIAPLERVTARSVTEALVLLRAAVEMCADARGFSLARASVLSADERELRVDLSLSKFFLEITQ